MLEVQLRGADWRSRTVALCCDDQAGPPLEYQVTVDMLRFFDAGFFGSPLVFRPGQMPDSTPILDGDRKNLLFDQGLPDSLMGGVFAWAHRTYAAMTDKI